MTNESHTAHQALTLPVTFVLLFTCYFITILFMFACCTRFGWFALRFLVVCLSMGLELMRTQLQYVTLRLLIQWYKRPPMQTNFWNALLILTFYRAARRIQMQPWDVTIYAGVQRALWLESRLAQHDGGHSGGLICCTGRCATQCKQLWAFWFRPAAGQVSG